MFHVRFEVQLRFREKERDGDDVGDDGDYPTPERARVEIHVDEFWKDVEFAEKVVLSVLPRVLLLLSSSSGRLHLRRRLRLLRVTSDEFPQKYLPLGNTDTRTREKKRERERVRDDDGDSDTIEVVVF